jgi:hypothetical protein
VTEPRVQQLLLTRFNVRSSGVGYRRDQPADWLERRFELFEKYCAPSVANQLEQDFEWLIFCHDGTDPEALARIAAADERIRIVAVPAATRPGQLLVSHYVRPDADVVISSRLDNDDALSRRALRRQREHLDTFMASGEVRQVFNPRLGYKLHLPSGRVYRASAASNPFLSMFERSPEAAPLLGALSGNHARMQSSHATFQDREEHLWLQVIHDRNVSNSLRPGDVEVDPEVLAGEDFQVLQAK